MSAFVRRAAASNTAVAIELADDAVADFEEFYRAEYGVVARLLYGMTGRWALAEEMTQEAFLAAHRDWPKVRSLDRPDLWVRRVGVNRAVSAHRRLVSEAAVLFRLRIGSPEVTEFQQTDRRVWDAVSHLPRRQAAALLLVAEGYTFGEVGEMLGCSDETARTHARRARERLRSLLTEEET